MDKQDRQDLEFRNSQSRYTVPKVIGWPSCSHSKFMSFRRSLRYCERWYVVKLDKRWSGTTAMELQACHVFQCSFEHRGPKVRHNPSRWRSHRI